MSISKIRLRRYYNLNRKWHFLARDFLTWTDSYENIFHKWHENIYSPAMRPSLNGVHFQGAISISVHVLSEQKRIRVIVLLLWKMGEGSIKNKMLWRKTWWGKIFLRIKCDRATYNTMFENAASVHEDVSVLTFHHDNP